jgi:GNAT superfamily N-acetyltransferase
MTATFADAPLARRLEGAEREACARFVDARAAVDPSVGAAWIDVHGTYAMFDGVASPSTQTFGFGLFAPPADADLDVIEEFFRERSAPVFHEVSPIADPAHIVMLATRGYQPIELSSVLYQSIADRGGAAPAADALTVRVVGPEEGDVWARTLAEGWSDVHGVGTLVGELARIMAARADAHLFLAEIDGRAVAAASLSISDGVALLAGASTTPGARRRGAQSALLAARLSYAAARGCDLAMVVALPGSGSQRNAERNGFRIAYTRTKWSLVGR